MDGLNTTALLTFKGTLAEALLETCMYPWEALPQIGQYIIQLIHSIDLSDFTCRGENIYVHERARIADSALILGPTVIDADSEVRHGAYIRGNALIGKSCVVGNSSEIKNSVLIEKVDVPHFSYVGDSILGIGAHFGAGVIASNLKTDKSNICVRRGDERVETGLRKFGAIVGDHADIGCNAVLAPGSVIGRGSRIYPLSFVRGYVPEESIYKTQGEIARIKPIP